jgi:hypothetical protein
VIHDGHKMHVMPFYKHWRLLKLRSAFTKKTTNGNDQTFTEVRLHEQAQEIVQLKAMLESERNRTRLAEYSVRLLLALAIERNEREKNRERSERKRKQTEELISYSVAMGGIFIPALLFVVVASIPLASLSFTVIRTSVATGFFLAP